MFASFFKPGDSETQYVSYAELHPSQGRCAKRNVVEVKQKLIDIGAAEKQADGTFVFKYHDGTSLFPDNKPFPVLKASFGYVLIDGHHDILASIEFKADMLPIRVIEDLSHLSPRQFWAEAEKNHWAYLTDLNGQRVMPPSSFAELIDDPNRRFAAITTRRYYSSKDGSFTSKGADYPLWLKVDKDIPFVEFRIADALFAQGFTYDLNQGDAPSMEMIEKARSILLAANIEGLRLVPTRTHHSDIDILKHLHSPAVSCCP